MSDPYRKMRLIWNIPKLVKNSWALFTNPAVPTGRKLIVILASLGYLIWPLDLIPDLPLLGQFDDLFIIFLLLNWFVNRTSPAKSSGSGGIAPDGDKDFIEADYHIRDEDGR